jgi:predicted nucleic acid-binding protein
LDICFLPLRPRAVRSRHGLPQKTVSGKQVVVSFQVINEVCFYLKKNGFPEPKLKKVISAFSNRCKVTDFSQSILETASDLRKRHSFSDWDSLITASASSAGCTTLYSEDMQDTRIIDAMHIKNPLKRL